MREQQIQKQIIDAFKAADLWCVKYPATADGTAGTPDLLACVDGTLVAIECKRDASEQPTRIQIYQMERIRRSGGIAIVGYSVHDVVAKLRAELDNRRLHREPGDPDPIYANTTEGVIRAADRFGRGAPA